MYFRESEAIVVEYPELQRAMESVDGLLAEIFQPSPLRPSDFARFLGQDKNHVNSIFELLVDRGVLEKEVMIECKRCATLNSLAISNQAMDEEEENACSLCLEPLEDSQRRVVIYEMTSQVLGRPRPAAADRDSQDIEEALGELARSAYVFRRLGQVWVLKFDGVMKLMEDARGLCYIARLLAEPDRDVWASHLLAAVAGIDPRVTAGISDPLVDQIAINQYRKQYQGLQGELEDSRAMNDLGRVGIIESEMEAFAMEIARVTGLGGKTRERSTIEKVRKSVSMAVARAIEGIRAEHDELGKHLDGFISSGVIFRYAPDRRIDWLT